MATNPKNNSGSGSKSNQTSSNRAGSNNSGNFANMDENKQREMASKGGKASHSGGNSQGRH
jgi:general stress protein YciG